MARRGTGRSPFSARIRHTGTRLSLGFAMGERPGRFPMPVAWIVRPDALGLRASPGGATHSGPGMHHRAGSSDAEPPAEKPITRRHGSAAAWRSGPAKKHRVARSATAVKGAPAGVLAQLNPACPVAGAASCFLHGRRRRRSARLAILAAPSARPYWRTGRGAGQGYAEEGQDRPNRIRAPRNHGRTGLDRRGASESGAGHGRTDGSRGLLGRGGRARGHGDDAAAPR